MQIRCIDTGWSSQFEASHKVSAVCSFTFQVSIFSNIFKTVPMEFDCPKEPNENNTHPLSLFNQSKEKPLSPRYLAETPLHGRYLELGSGTGLVGMACALLGAEVRSKPLETAMLQERCVKGKPKLRHWTGEWLCDSLIEICL